MPLRPFPYALRVGTDICNVPRVRRLLAKQRNDQPFLFKFMKRVFTEPERTYFWHRFGSQHEVFDRIDAVSEYIAGRFAAKEAIRKACDFLGNTSRGFHHIMILPIAPSSDHRAHQSGPPQGLILDAEYDEASIEKHPGSKHIELSSLSGQLCEISISHDGDFATAVALVPTQAHRNNEITVAGKGSSRPAASASVMSMSQHVLDAWKGDLAKHRPIEHSLGYIDVEETFRKELKELTADLRRPNATVNRASELRSEERMSAGRKKK